MGLLATGQAELCIAGGVEFCSDQVPPAGPANADEGPPGEERGCPGGGGNQHSAPLHHSSMQVGRRMLEFGPASLAPEIPDPREFSTAEVDIVLL